ncbi:MAG: ABC transporter ATP-binding protein [Myxococcota bacterium]
MTIRLESERELSNRESLRLIRRAFSYVGPLKGRFAVKLILATISIFPILILPWPFKILVDHVIRGVPIGEEATAYPSYIEPLVYTLQGATRSEIAFAVAFFSLFLVFIIGGYGERRGANANLASGTDAATVSENRANSASSASGGLIGWMEFKWQIDLTQRLNHFYRSQVFDRIHALPLTRLDDQQIGDAVYRVMYDTPQITELCYRLILTPIVSPLHILLAAWILLETYAAAPVIAWIPFLILPLSFVATYPFAALVRRRAEATRTTGARTTASIEETMTNILAVQSLGGRDRERDRFDRDSWNSYTSVRSYILLVVIVGIVGGVAASLVALYVFYVVTDLVFEGVFSVGDFGVIFSYYFQIAGSTGAIASIWINLQNEVAALKRVFYVMDLPGEDDPPGAVPLDPIREGVRFENAAYSYPDGTQALTDVTLEARVGQVVGLVGPAGAGKTTLAYLVPRFLEPTQGRVLIDGTDLQTVTRASLRSQVSFVFQETVLLDATVAENLRLAKPDASDFELRRAAEIAGADEFIQRLPQGYDTPLGRDGGALSVGQRQRLSIARALVRQSPILILDEPTSALDPETERRLVSALHEASRTSLVLVIAHRLSSIRTADQILFLEGGRVLESGTHEELMGRSGGAYRRFVDLQTRGAA